MLVSLLNSATSFRKQRQFVTARERKQKNKFTEKKCNTMAFDHNCLWPTGYLHINVKSSKVANCLAYVETPPDNKIS